DAFVACAADVGTSGFPGVMLGELADGFGTLHNFGVGLPQLGFKLAQKFFALALENSGIGNLFGIGLNCFRRKSWNNSGDPLFVMADRAVIEVGGVIEMALRTRQAVPGMLARGAILGL
ncbi:MAG TPA: hypothetical protein VJQ54_10845, partial [Candidatus Sulfotelmatobacter sp.]|nr:hypothetical protein [Candidatus Sulfotelmatobacter sp.]